MLLNFSLGSREVHCVPIIWLLQMSRPGKTLCFTIRYKSKLKIFGRSEIVVLLNPIAKSPGSPWSTFSWSPLPLHCPVSQFTSSSCRERLSSGWQGNSSDLGAPAEAVSSHLGLGRAGGIPPHCSPGTSIVQRMVASWSFFSEWLQDVLQNCTETHPMHPCTWHGKELRWCSRGTALQVKQSEVFTCWKLYRNLAGARSDYSYSWNRRYLIKWLMFPYRIHIWQVLKEQEGFRNIA